MAVLLGATATPDWGALPWGWITLAGFVWLAGYAIACRWRPFAHCGCCKGSGRHYSKNGKTFRDCWWCNHTGRRLRVGRKVYNALSAARRDAS